MRYDIRAATDDWSLWEVVKRKRHPFSDPLENASDKELSNVFAALRLLLAAGCPPDLERGCPDVQKIGTCEVVLRPKETAKVDLYVLKAKPSGWRLYFYVKDRESKQIEFLHAVHKKRDARDPKDFQRCCRLIEDVYSGVTSSEPIDVPPR